MLPTNNYNPHDHRVFTKTNLDYLVKTGYLKTVNHTRGSAFQITEKTKKTINTVGYNINVLQDNYKRQDLTHALLISDCILKLQSEPNFFQVFYPQFREPPKYDWDWLKPDACIVWKNKNAYKIQFLEIEQPKPDWENYLLEKTVCSTHFNHLFVL